MTLDEPAPRDLFYVIAVKGCGFISEYANVIYDKLCKLAETYGREIDKAFPHDRLIRFLEYQKAEGLDDQRLLESVGASLESKEGRQSLSPSLMSVCRKAAIFDFKSTSVSEVENALWRDMDKSTANSIQESFFLPFPVVAIEDKESLIVIEDLDPSRVGLSAVRFVTELVVQPEVVGLTFGLYNSHGLTRDPLMGIRTNTTYLFLGHCMLDPSTKKMTYVRGWDAVGESLLRGLSKECAKNAWATVQQIGLVNSPTRFILEEGPRKKRSASEKRDRGRVARSAKKPKYTILEPGAIRVKMGLRADGGTGTQSPHKRRAHVRTYRHNRYKDMLGKTQAIPATWIGPSEAEHLGRSYRVILNH